MWTWLGIILLSALLGWLSSVASHAESGREILLRLAAGIAGGILGGLFLAPNFGGGAIGQGGFSLPNLLISLLGAIVVLAIVHLLLRRSLAR